jgi:hypothetical protein
VFSVNAQTKKEQIENLNDQIDSLSVIINSDRTDCSKKIIYLENTIDKLNHNCSEFEKQILTLNEKVSTLSSELEASVLESASLHREFNNLQLQIQSKKDSLDLLRRELEKFEDFSINTSIKLISNPEFEINEKFLIETVVSKMKNICPEQDILGNTGPEICKKIVTAMQYFSIDGKIRLFAGVGFPFEGSHADVGSNGFILMEYNNNQWQVIDFLEYQEIDGMQWGNALELKNPSIIGKKAFCFFNEYGITSWGDFYGYLNLFVVNDIQIIHVNLGETEVLTNDSDNSNILEKYSCTYKIIPSNKELYDIEKQRIENNNITSTGVLVFDSISREYNLLKK